MMNKTDIYPEEVIPYRRERNGIVCLCDGCDPATVKFVFGRDMRQHRVCTGYEECARCGFNQRVAEERKRYLRLHGTEMVNGRRAAVFGPMLSAVYAQPSVGS